MRAPPTSRHDAPERPLRLGIFGGSFDPLHLGHLIVAETAREQLGLDRVDFLPAAGSPHKLGLALAPDRDRAAMVEAAIEGQAAFRLSRIDLDRPAPSYTVDSLGLIRAAEDPGTRIWWILGADALADFARWREPQGILDLAGLAVFGRPGHPRPPEAGAERTEPHPLPAEAGGNRPEPHPLPTQVQGQIPAQVYSQLPAPALDRLPAGLSGHLDYLDGPMIGISARDIRARVRQGRSIRYLVSPAVEAYIEAEGLYRA